jgi:N-acyl-D-aspartate/D-glutamate deacylase
VTEFDLVVRGGVVVDGSGGEPFTGDIAIEGGVIRQVGRVDGRGRRELDADGAVVAPGFVDIHTHYDAQSTWDSRMQPSSWHGVTTAVMGNCGVGFAPAVSGNRGRLIELMEGVEDIPGVAMQEGLTWQWESFPDFLDYLDQRRFDIDVACQLPHAALRVQVMGERAAAYAAATDSDVAEMAHLAAEAVDAGAIGFSTSRTINHKSASGEIIPSYEASERELVEIARAIGTTHKGVLQVANDYDDLDRDFRLFRAMAAASGRPLSLSVAHDRRKPERTQQILDRITEANNDGLTVRAQVPVRSIGYLLGLQCTLHPLIMNPVWIEELSALPAAGQARRMQDPALRDRVLAAQSAELNQNVIGGRRVQQWEQMHELSDPPDYEPSPRTSVASIARRTGRTPIDVAYDVLIGAEGRAMLYILATGYENGRLDVERDMLVHQHAIPGLSDGGAHVGTICDASFPTFLLQHWVRDRDGDRLSLAFAVQRQARDTARAAGLTDRGTLSTGKKADLNVIDMDRLQVHRPEMHFDLPAGGKRLLQRADGYRHTVVSGVETYRDGQPTGELPGRLQRSQVRAPAEVA